MKTKIEKGKCYKSLVGNEYIRVDGFDENGDPLGVIFESFETYLTFSSNTYIEMAFYMGDYQEVTEKEFYTALDLAKGQFIKDFKAVRGGVFSN